MLKRIEQYLYNMGMLRKSEVEIFRFGLEVCIHNFKIILLCLLSGIYLKHIDETLIFLIFYPLFNHYFHGLHAETKTRWLISSLTIFHMSIWMFNHISIKYILLLSLAIIICILVIGQFNQRFLPPDKIGRLSLLRDYFYTICFFIAAICSISTSEKLYKMLLIVLILIGGGYLILQRFRHQVLYKAIYTCTTLIIMFGTHIAPNICVGWGYEFKVPADLGKKDKK